MIDLKKTKAGKKKKREKLYDYPLLCRSWIDKHVLYHSTTVPNIAAIQKYEFGSSKDK